MTVNNIQNINSKTGAIVIPILMLLAVLLICFVYSMKQLIVSLITNKKISMPFIYALCLSLLITYLIPQYKNMIFSSYYDSYLEQFQNEEEIINLINENKTGKLYSTDVPEYYSRYFKGFSSGLLQGEELAKEKDITVITDVSNDAEGFILNGFKWMQISDNHAIYTNDEQIISILEENGYQLDSYYSKENSMDVSYWAWMNNMSADEYGQLNVVSGVNNLEVGPYIYLRNTSYSFTLNLYGLGSISGNPISSDQPIANIYVRYVDSDAVLFENQIYPEFDENGNYSYEFSLTSWRLSNVYMSVEPINDSSFWIRSVTYKKCFIE